MTTDLDERYHYHRWNRLQGEAWMNLNDLGLVLVYLDYDDVRE